MLNSTRQCEYLKLLFLNLSSFHPQMLIHRAFRPILSNKYKSHVQRREMSKLLFGVVTAGVLSFAYLNQGTIVKSVKSMVSITFICEKEKWLNHLRAVISR